MGTTIVRELIVSFGCGESACSLERGKNIPPEGRHQYQHMLSRVLISLAVIATTVLCLSEPTAAQFRRNIGGPTATPTTARPAASVFNPAALTGVEGTQLQADLAILGGYFIFERARTDPQGNPYKPVLLSDTLPLPFIAFKTDFGTGVFEAGFDAYVPLGNTATFPEGGAQRYSLVSGTFVPLHLAFPIAFHTQDRRLGIGFGPKLVIGYLSTSLDIDVSDITGEAFGSKALPEEDPNLAARITVDPTTDVTYGWYAGLYYKPTPRWRFSLAYHSAVDMTFDTSVRIHFPKFTKALQPTFNAVGATQEVESSGTLTTRIPMYITAGMRYQPWREWINELFFQWAKWSDTSGISTTITHSPLKRLSSLKKENPPNNDDLRIGMLESYNLLAWWALGGQFLYVRHMIPDRGMAPSNLDFDSLVPTVFTEFLIAQKWTTCVGYSRVFNIDRTVIMNRQKQETTDTLSWTSNPDARYRSELDQLSLNVTYRF